VPKYFHYAFILSVCIAVETAGAWKVEGQFIMESTSFFHSPQFEDQARDHFSLQLEPEFRSSISQKAHLIFTPYYRWDKADSQARHFDLRELSLQSYAGDWEWTIGISRVFWGVTESLHLVDIINQTDLVVSLDGETKLGQPMIMLGWKTDIGMLESFILPCYRARTFAGPNGRLRMEPSVQSGLDDLSCRSPDNSLDFALRWSHTRNDVDLAVSYFNGTSREPNLILITQDSKTWFKDSYEDIRQLGLELALVNDGWLWKLEAIHRTHQSTSFWATVGGFEYTFTGIGTTSWDLGLLMEYQYDDRGELPNVLAQNDIFLGQRWVWNDFSDTDFLAGVVVDGDNSQRRTLRIEFGRRLSNSVALSAQAYFFSSEDLVDPGYVLRRDDHLRLSLEYYF